MGDSISASDHGEIGPIERILRDKIVTGFSPSRYSIVNDSPAHAGHAGAASGAKGESHFSISIVSSRFSGMTRLQRNRLVHELLAAELREHVHALTLTLQSPEEDTRDG